MINSDTFPLCPVIHPKRHRELMEESLTQWTVNHTVYSFLRWKCGGHTEKQEHQTVHMGSPSPGVARGSPVLEPQTTRSPAVISAIQNFLKLMTLFGKHCCLLPSSPFEPKILVIIGEIRVIAITKDNMDKFNKSSKKKCK